MVELERPIVAGSRRRRVKLHPEVVVTVGVNVARRPTKPKCEPGIDVIAAMFEEEQAAAAAVALEPDSEDEYDDATPPSEAAGDAPAVDADDAEAAQADEA